MRRQWRHLWFQQGGAVASPPPPPAAVAPTITSSATFSAAENQTAVGTIVATGDATMVYSIIGGADQALFDIDSSSGALTFSAAPDFDDPGDDDTDNDYEVEVQADNGVSPADTMELTVSVTDVADIVPIVTASQSFSVVENAADNAVVGTVLVTAGDSAVDDFEFTSGNTGTAFAISDSGVITKIEDLDEGTLSSYTLATRSHNAAGWSASVNVGVTVTAAVDWPSVVAFADYVNPAPVVSMSVPTLLTPTVDPRMTTPHVPGGVVQTKLTRITPVASLEPPVTGDPWNNFGPEYALLQHWSKDGDMLALRAILIDSAADEQPHALYTAMHVVDATDYSNIGPCFDVPGYRGVQGGAWRWSNSVNDQMICLKVLDSSYSEPRLDIFTPTTRTWSVLKDFSATYEHQYAGFKYTGEATQSRDGRYWALCMQKTGGQWYIVIWDRTLDVVTREWAVSSDVTSHNISFGVSPLGTYMWTASFGGEVVAGNTLAGGVNVFSIATGSLVASLGEMNGGSNPIGHTGPNTDSGGNEIWVWGHGAPSAALNERGIVSWRMDGSSGTSYTTHLPAGKYLGFDYLNHCVPGYVVWSDYPVPTSNSTYSDFPLRGQMIALPLDGSGNIKLITSSRISKADHTALDNNGYATYPWCTSNRDLSKALFKSCMSEDWSGGITLPFHAYIATP